MILAFSQKLNDIPTYFIEQINNCLVENGIATVSEIDAFETRYSQKFGFDLTHLEETKLHTIRKDTSNRWKAGNDIHFSINVRTKNQFQFAPVVKCISTQKIEIIWYDEDNLRLAKPAIFIEDRWISEEEVNLLAKNDGFNSVDDFLSYFNTDFTGKIIHWTNLKY